MGSFWGKHWGVSPTYQETAPEVSGGLGGGGLKSWRAKRKDVPGVGTAWTEGQHWPKCTTAQKKPWIVCPLCGLVWDLGLSQNTDWEENSHPFAMASRGRTRTGGDWLHMKCSFASDRLCGPGDVTCPLWDSVATPMPRSFTASLSINKNWVRYNV